MSKKFNVGDRVAYCGPYTHMHGMLATVVENKTGNGNCHAEFDEDVSKWNGGTILGSKGPNYGWRTAHENFKLVPRSAEEKLSDLLNKRITPEQYERM